MLPQVPPHFSIYTMLSKACTCPIIIFDLYGLYCVLMQQTGFAFPLLMDNLYPWIMHFSPSIQKKSQYFFNITINCYFISGITLLLNLICLCSSSLCPLSLNVIKYLWLHSSHVFWVCILPSRTDKNKYSFVYVICIIWGDVSVFHFWSPDFWSYLYHHKITLCGYTLELWI